MLAHKIKNVPAMQETWVWSLGQKDPQENGMATHYSILACRIYGQRSLLSYNPRGRIELDPAKWLTFSLYMWTKVSLYVTQSRKYIDFTKLSIHCFYRWKTLKADVVKNHELCSIFLNLFSCYYIHRCSITSVSPLSPIRTRKWLIYLYSRHN